MARLLASRPVLWLLFLFNGAVAAFCALAVDSTQGTLAVVGRGAVSLGAGLGLLPPWRREPRPGRA
ncbi:hypothetical protein [Streptomyces durhamensis]|uniref:hypothetical protein n=1 Tax=Streptomyces durhamensis TaxID=68194 RepID=UPI0004CCE2D1|nr:hypothetical protein [Streptomyces durhamensis]